MLVEVVVKVFSKRRVVKKETGVWRVDLPFVSDFRSDRF